MDPMDQFQTNQATTCNSSVGHNYDFMKRTLLFLLVPVSLFSLFLSFTTGFSYIYSSNFSLLNLTFPTFLQALERKYMFLICNGILAFLAKTFSFTRSENHPSVPDPDVSSEEDSNVVQERGDEPLLPESQEVPPPPQDKQIVSWEVTEEENSPHGEWKEEGKKGVLISEESDPEEEENGDDVMMLTSSSGSGANEVMNMNTEELNKKFEEFIRKMKEEIRVEAQQHLIAAV